jgi:pyruvate-formate lyase
MKIMVPKFVAEIAKTGNLVVSAIHVSNKERRLSDQFVKDCIAQMRPFTRALIETQPHQLNGNMDQYLRHLGVSEEQRDVLEDLMDAESRHRDFQDDKENPDATEGFALRMLMRFLAGINAVQYWALKRQLIKTYARLATTTG